MDENKNPAPPVVATDENQIMAERRGKLAAIRCDGQAFPNAVRRNALSAGRHAAADGRGYNTL
mgnify:CR=1 FL=1